MFGRLIGKFEEKVYKSAEEDTYRGHYVKGGLKAFGVGALDGALVTLVIAGTIAMIQGTIKR